MKAYVAKKELNEVCGTVIENNKLIDLLCGKCGNLLYGWDEEICPSCGAFNDLDQPMN